jgi:sugar lactone lactonase YvrE
VAGIVNSPGIAANQLNYPFGIALDSSDSLYIIDQSNNRAQRYLPGASSGTTLAIASGAACTDPSYMFAPTDICVDSNHNIYIVTNCQTVQLWLNGSSTGTIVAGTGKKNLVKL